MTKRNPIKPLRLTQEQRESRKVQALCRTAAHLAWAKWLRDHDTTYDEIFERMYPE